MEDEINYPYRKHWRDTNYKKDVSRIYDAVSHKKWDLCNEMLYNHSCMAYLT